MNKRELRQIIREEIIKESAMSTLDIIAQEAKDFNDFVKKAMAEFPELKRNKQSSIKWLKDMYAEPLRERATDNYDVFDTSKVGKEPLRGRVVPVDVFLQYLKSKKIDYTYDKNHDELSFDSEWLDKKGWNLIKQLGIKMKYRNKGNVVAEAPNQLSIHPDDTEREKQKKARETAANNFRPAVMFNERVQSKKVKLSQVKAGQVVEPISQDITFPFKVNKVERGKWTGGGELGGKTFILLRGVDTWTKKDRVYKGLPDRLIALHLNESEYTTKTHPTTIQEGSDWIILPSLGKEWAIDGFDGFFFKWKEFSEEIEYNTPKWKALYKKLNSKDKKTVDSVVKDISR